MLTVSRLAKMISHVEANQAWLESIAYQMSNMTYAQQSKLLGGPIGLLKSHATRSAHEIADEAVNIFGGREATKIPLAYGAFCATLDWAMVVYFVNRRRHWVAAWKSRA